MSETTENTAGGIFVVEDDEQIARMLGDLLEDEGYRVRLGSNGNALTTALAAPPDLFLLDVMMPVSMGASSADACAITHRRPRFR